MKPRHQASPMNLWRLARRVKPLDLTSRQREIIQLVAESHTDHSIAAELHITTSLVEHEIAKIKQIFGFDHRNVAILTRWAAANHLIDIEPIKHLHD